VNRYYFLSAALSLGISALLGLWLIPYLRRLKFGQTILDIGPAWHKSKQGTPTMGGLMFIASITTACACVYFTASQSAANFAPVLERLAGRRFVAGF
jgi:phospho-N-acetylmuramoyl-pentapeptide-transferase